jgi:hypothetical protein
MNIQNLLDPALVERLFALMTNYPFPTVIIALVVVAWLYTRGCE